MQFQNRTQTRIQRQRLMKHFYLPIKWFSCHFTVLHEHFCIRRCRATVTATIKIGKFFNFESLKLFSCQLIHQKHVISFIIYRANERTHTYARTPHNTRRQSPKLNHHHQLILKILINQFKSYCSSNASHMLSKIWCVSCTMWTRLYPFLLSFYFRL